MNAFDEVAFRASVRDFIARNAPTVEFRTGTRAPADQTEAALLRGWSAALYTNGFSGAGWPEEFGGRADFDPIEDFVVSEELARVRAPVVMGSGSLMAHALLRFGTPEQRQQYLPPIRSSEHVWCQLFSEPDAGSDLASLRTSAVRDGDDYVITGQKVWSTNAQYSDMGYLLARTDPDAPKHAGISAFMLDLATPGITIRPMREMTGTADFNEVFLDAVRAPATCRIGDENQGWQVATDSLASERATTGALVIMLRQNLDALVHMCQSRTGGAAAHHSGDARVRQRLAALHTRVEIATLMAQATMQRRLRGEIHEADVPLIKLSFATTNYDLAEYGLSSLGLHGLLSTDAPEAPDQGRWQDELLYAKAYTISGGSNEIMRNLLAERALGLPREVRPESPPVAARAEI